MQSESRHAKTFRPPGTEFPSVYKVELRGQPPLELPVKTVLGGDRFGLSSILEMKSLSGTTLPRTTLIEGRFMHSVRAGQRVLSPGFSLDEPASYATAAGRVLSPLFEKKCMTCHGAPTELKREPGVRCESCHGPGGKHVAAVGRKSNSFEIVNAGKLPPSDFLALCAQCHSGFFSLSDPRPDDLLISNQVTALTNSACYLRGGRRLTCKMCHDAHSNAPHDSPKYDRACLSCHGASVKGSKSCSNRRTAGCPECHMPVVKRTDSFPLKDHWIRVVERKLAENVRAKVARAASLAEQGHKTEAIRLLEDLLPQGSNEPSLFYNLGLAYEEVGRIEDALRSYRRALELEPDMVAAHINSGSILLSRKKFDEAVQQFRKAIDVNPLEVAAHYNLAIALQEKGDTEGVERELRTVVVIDPRMKQSLKVR